MAHRKFRCYVHGKGSEWEAICTDLDISVEGDSEADQKRFLKRKSPLWLRSLYYWRLVLFRLYGKQSSQKEYVLNIQVQSSS